MIIAAVIIAGAAIAVALITTRSHPGPTNAGPPASTAVSPSASTNDTNSGTCQAWPGTKAALLAIPQLPDGWDWTTPNIDTYIRNRTAAIAKALDLFEPQIAPQPARIAASAHDYVETRRKEIQLLLGHTYTEADGVPVTAAETKLDQLCHVTDHQ